MTAAPGGPIRILCFVASLGGGGAEKHLVRVLNRLDPSRYHIRIVVVQSRGSYETELPPHVELRELSSKKLSLSVPALSAEIRNFSPDIVHSLMDEANIVTSMALSVARCTAPLVISVQNSYERLKGRSAPLSMRIVYHLLPFFYRRTDSVMAISAGVRRDIVEMSPDLATRTRVIYNAGYDDRTLALAQEEVPLPEVPNDHKLVVACGRLTEQKGFDHLLSSFHDLTVRIPSTLWILGTGELEDELRARAESLGISDRVGFLGFRENPYAVMRRADLFVLSSLWEGFGNVIVEAMAVGTPVVATACPHGPSEIIEPEVSGLLVPPADEKALTDAMFRVLDDTRLAVQLREGGVRRARAFSAAVIAKQYAAAFEEVLDGRAPTVTPEGA